MQLKIVTYAVSKRKETIFDIMQILFGIFLTCNYPNVKTKQNKINQ